MKVFPTVVDDAEPEALVAPLPDDLLSSSGLDEDAFWAEADGTEELAGAEEPGMALPLSRDEGGALAAIADDFLGELVAAEFQTVGWLGVDGEETGTLGETPVAVGGVVVPLPDGGEGGEGEGVGMTFLDPFCRRSG